MLLKRLMPELRPVLRLFENEPLWSHSFGRFMSPSSLSFGRGEQGISPWSQFPVVDLRETNKCYLIDAELPGIDKSNISIECVDDRTLILKGSMEGKSEALESPEDLKIDDSDGVVPSGAERAERAKASSVMRARAGHDSAAVADTQSDLRSATFWHSERFSGSFFRSFTFPSPIQTDRIQAKFRNGLLSISALKLEKKGVKINVEAEEDK